MKIKTLHQNFPEFQNLENEQIRFVNRIRNLLFVILKDKLGEDEFSGVSYGICIILGEDVDNVLQKNDNSLNILKELSKGDYFKTLEIIVHLYESLINDEKLKNAIDKIVKLTINQSSPILNLNWIDGVFYPAGDSTLDKELIAYSSFLLEKYPEEQKDLHNALSNYKAKKYDDVLHHCFTCIEGLTRKLLNNKRALTKNKEELLTKLEADQNWKSIINRFFDFINDYGRHGGAKRHEKKEEEVEAALYQTCLLVRLIMRKMEKKAE